MQRTVHACARLRPEPWSIRSAIRRSEGRVSGPYSRTCCLGFRLACDVMLPGIAPLRSGRNRVGTCPLEGKRIRAAGLAGGGLASGTHDGWCVERHPFAFPDEELFVGPPGQTMLWTQHGVHARLYKLGGFDTAKGVWLLANRAFTHRGHVFRPADFCAYRVTASGEIEPIDGTGRTGRVGLIPAVR